MGEVEAGLGQCLVLLCAHRWKNIGKSGGLRKTRELVAGLWHVPTGGDLSSPPASQRLLRGYLITIRGAVPSFHG